MQKITRIYVGNYGVNAAWYDGLIFDLTDAMTKEATDALINLENGGGKTTFLSFVFSCFETPQDKFLKHLQNANHRFGQYFSSDGRPGFILIEWEMPPKVVGGSPYRLVVGQVVSVKSRSDKTDIDRVFFSFEVTEQLRLESVPAPKLDHAPAETLTHVSKWFHDTQRFNNDFFYTRGQSDWQKHLRDERLIDVEMLQLQVFFSAQEGGIDTSFLTFKSEPEFIHKFFDLTVDATRASAVRETVVNTCDKLSKKPDTQLRLNELTKLESSLGRFQEGANQYSAAMATRDAAHNGGEGLVVSLEHRVQTLRQRVDDEIRQAGVHRQTLALKAATKKTLTEKVDAISHVQHHRALERAAVQRAETEAAHAGSKKKLVHLEAARAKTEASQALSVRKELEARAALAEASLQPWRDSVEKQGALLRHALQASMAKAKLQQQSAESLVAEAKKEDARLNQERARNAENDSNLRSEATKLETLEAACTSARISLEADGTMQSAEIPGKAIKRWVSEAAQHTESAKQSRARIEEHVRTSEGYRTDAGRLRTDAAKLSAISADAQRFVAEGEIERERLSQLPIARLAADADMADPESPALLTALLRLAQGSANEVALSSVRLSQLNASSSSILETGVTGQSSDVNAVVARLKEIGVKSATAFNTYIAKAVSDSDAARALIRSNPARFLGVCIASSEMKKARTLAVEGLALVAPVMISAATLEPEVTAADNIVIPAADDAAFNFAAAQVLLESLHARVAAEASSRDFYATQQSDAMLAKERFERFVKRFGEGKLQRRIEEIQRLDFEAETLTQRADMLDGQAVEALGMADSCRAKAAQADVAAALCQRHLRDIEKFVETHESGRRTRLTRLDEIVKLRSGLHSRANEIACRLEELANVRETQLEEVQLYKTQHLKRSEEFSAVKYYGEVVVDGDDGDGPSSIDSLANLYASAAIQYESEEHERIGIVKIHLDIAREEHLQKEKMYSSRFGDVSEDAMAPFLTKPYEDWLPVISREIEVHESAKIAAGQTHAVAVAAMNRLKHPNELSVVAVEAAGRASDDELAAESEQAADEIEKTDAAVEQMVEFLQLLQKSIEASQSQEHRAKVAAQTLRTSLSMPEILGAEPSTIEDDFESQVSGIIQQFRERERTVNHARTQAMKLFDDVKSLARSEALSRVEPDISAQLQRNDFDAACSDGERILAGIADRIGTTNSMLEGMQADFNACVGELSNLANTAISLLVSATNKRVPANAPWVGGMPMFKMQAKFNEVQQEARKLALRNYLDSLIDTKVVPAKGAAMVAEAVSRIYGRSLGVKLLKMSPDVDLQYVAVDKIQNSGGEAVVMAMFLYLLINQIRSETQAKVRRNGGGPLILDNPFAKATNPAMWKAQRLLAAAMDVQLIFATALPDYNAVADFPRFIHLRKAGKNTKSNRWHLEIVDFTLRDNETETA
ncbi:hypothetical protein NHH73_02850 [Oxalobacteraceae bacterium OTU3CINTB1]|nr:hypothetical protein NHH73_02850 [Oxalobacteraceae bacterium OTU3CINTB1]